MDKPRKNKTKAYGLSSPAEILESISDGFYALDRNWCFIYANKRTISTTVATTGELLGQNLWQIFPDLVGTDVEFAFRKAMLEGLFQETESQSPFNNRWYHNRVYPSKAGISVYWQDVTDRKQAEEALGESEEKYRCLFEQVLDGYAMVNSLGIITEWNASQEQITGFKRAEVIGRPLWEVNYQMLPGELKAQLSADQLKAAVQEILLTKQSSILNKAQERTMIRADGERRTIALSLFMVNLKNDFLVGSASRDITRQKQAEEALKKLNEELELRVNERTVQLAESEEKYRSLVENANEVITIVQDGIIKFFGGKASELTGYLPEEVISKSFLDVVFPDDRQKAMETYLRYMDEGISPAGEFRVVRKDGAIRWAQINATKITWEKRPAILAMFTDITERKEMEQTLKDYAQKITMVQEEERKKIAYELHDDTAQYLAILKLELDSLLNSGKIQDPKILEKLEFLEKDASRAVDDVRRYSHELRPGVLEHLGLQAALEQIAEDHNKMGQIQISVNVEGPEPKLSEDIKLGFFRIAQEAINNTRKHAKTSQASINLKYSDNHIQMIVSDDGVGFDVQKASARIGEKGSLGLTSMQERAKLIGASLTIYSKPGKGTQATVDMPLIDQA
jgi:PAS domain S-box-containing protein